MEVRRNLKRKALADCTNTIPRKPFSDHTNISTFVPHSKKPFSSSLTKSTLSIRNSDENSFTSCESNNEENPRFRIPQPSSTPPTPTIATPSDSGNFEFEDAENPRIRTSDSGNCESDDAENPRICPQPSTPPRPTTITAANSDDFNCEDSGVGTVYTRRKTVEKTRDKGKAVTVSSSYPRFRIPQPSSTPPAPTIVTPSDSGNCESEDAENPRIRTSDSGNCESDDAENPRIHPQPSTPPRPTTITAANSDDFNCEDSGVGTVYTRRKTVEKTRDKGKAVMVSSSYPRFRIPQPSSTPPAPTIATPSDSGNCEFEDAENLRIRTSDSGNCDSDDAENPRIRPQPSTPPRPTTITAANSDDFNCEDSGAGTVYTRRKTVEKTRDKGKAVMVSSSCPPAERTRRNEDQLDKENRDVNLPKSYSSTVACPKAKKERRNSVPLPQDFINKQKAYFAEIDAFELPEEVVSESELE